MNKQNVENHYDVIIVGSGTCGATIARELSKQKKKVLILERGVSNPLKESFLTLATITDIVPLGGKLMTMRALTTGGSTALYLALAEPPPIDVFNSLGIDLTNELEETRKELPITYLPEELLSPQTKRLKEGAQKLGYKGAEKMLFVDNSKCTSGYSYEAKWKARSFITEAVSHGTTLINRATVTKIIIENNQAVGVEYKLSKSNSLKVYGEKIVLAAGSAASPIILRDSGFKNVEDHGFFIDPNCGLFGTIPGLKAKDNFMGSWSFQYNDDIQIGDLNPSRLLYKMLMLASKPQRMFSFSSSIGIGVKVKDSLGGVLLKNNRYQKQLTNEDYSKLKVGEEVAEKVLKSIGAKNIFRSSYGATSLSGTLKIGKHVNEKLETEYKNLFVCDGSLIPESVRVSPNLTLICMGRYLSKHLINTL